MKKESKRENSARFSPINRYVAEINPGGGRNKRSVSMIWIKEVQWRVRAKIKEKTIKKPMKLGSQRINEREGHHR